MVMSLRDVYGEGHSSLRQATTTVAVPQPASQTVVGRHFVETRRHEERIVTQTALGGGFRLELSHDGLVHFSGSVRATGWPSFRVSLAVAVHLDLPSLRVAGRGGVVVFEAHGTAKGTNRAGHRTYAWAQNFHSAPVRSHWGAIRGARISRDFQYSTDALGVAGDVLALLGQLTAMNLIIGPAGSGLVIAGRAADELGLEALVLPGLVGMVGAGGAVFALGPGAAYPAFWSGVGVAATGLAVRQRRLNGFEQNVCDQVFGAGRIDYSRVILTNRLGLDNRPFCLPTPGGPILVNIGEHAFRDPLHYSGSGAEADDGGPREGRLIMHEMTHVWQILHDRFTPALFCRAVVASASGQYAYADTPWRPFGEWGTDQQAEIVADWYAGGKRAAAPTAKEPDPQFRWGPRNQQSPWYPSIAGALRGGVD